METGNEAQERVKVFTLEFIDSLLNYLYCNNDREESGDILSQVSQDACTLKEELDKQGNLGKWLDKPSGTGYWWLKTSENFAEVVWVVWREDSSTSIFLSGGKVEATNVETYMFLQNPNAKWLYIPSPKYGKSRLTARI